MSFLTRESSRRSSAPVQLLKVVHGGISYTLTPNDEAQVHDSETYDATTLSITPPSSGSGAEGVLTFALPVTHPLALALRGGAIAEPATVTLFNRHRGDTEFLVGFLGDVAGTAQQAERLLVTCGSLVSKQERKLPTLTVMRTCGNMLYDARCQVVKEDFQYDAGTVSAIAGRVLTVTGLATFADTDHAYFVGGAILKAGLLVGFVTHEDGDNLTLLADPPSDLAVDDAVTVLAGCDRTIATCFRRFANQQHCNCWHTLPLRDPFSGRGLRP